MGNWKNVVLKSSMCYFLFALKPNGFRVTLQLERQSCVSRLAQVLHPQQAPSRAQPLGSGQSFFISWFPPHTHNKTSPGQMCIPSLKAEPEHNRSQWFQIISILCGKNSLATSAPMFLRKPPSSPFSKTEKWGTQELMVDFPWDKYGTTLLLFPGPTALETSRDHKTHLFR